MPTPAWLLPAFEAGVHTFSDACPAARGCDIRVKHKGPDIASIEGWVDCGGFALLFEYTAHAMMSEVNSVLECKVSADRDNTGAPRYSLMDVFNALELKDFRCVMIPSITGEAAMAAAFQWLGEIAAEHLPAIAALLADEERHYRLYACFTADVQLLFPRHMVTGYDAVERKNLELYYGLLRGRFGFARGTYMRFLAGKNASARKKLARTKKALLYERRLLAYLEANADVPAPLPPTLSGQAKSDDARYLLALFAPWLPLALLCLPFWLGVFYLLRAVALRGQLLLIGPDPGVAVILPTFLTAIALCFFTRRIAIRLLFRKRAAEMLESDSMMFSRGAQRFMKGFLYLVYIGCALGLLLYVNSNVAFGEAGFTDNRGVFSVQSEYRPYDYIDHIYYKPERVNGYGDTIPKDSYVLVLRDGSEIDLFGLCEMRFAVEEVLPLLEGAGVEEAVENAS